MLKKLTIRLTDGTTKEVTGDNLETASYDGWFVVSEQGKFAVYQVQQYAVFDASYEHAT